MHADIGDALLHCLVILVGPVVTETLLGILGHEHDYKLLVSLIYLQVHIHGERHVILLNQPQVHLLIGTVERSRASGQAVHDATEVPQQLRPYVDGQLPVKLAMLIKHKLRRHMIQLHLSVGCVTEHVARKFLLRHGLK